jgi:hypothetical protein
MVANIANQIFNITQRNTKTIHGENIKKFEGFEEFKMFEGLSAAIFQTL